MKIPPFLLALATTIAALGKSPRRLPRPPAMSGKSTLFSLAFAFAFAGATAKEDEWTRFRGPNGTGHGQAKGLPVQWTDKDYTWKVKLPGVGHSSPVLWGERLFTTCADEGDGSSPRQAGEGRVDPILLHCVYLQHGRSLRRVLALGASWPTFFLD